MQRFPTFVTKPSVIKSENQCDAMHRIRESDWKRASSINDADVGKMASSAKTSVAGPTTRGRRSQQFLYCPLPSFYRVLPTCPWGSFHHTLLPFNLSHSHGVMHALFVEKRKESILARRSGHLLLNSISSLGEEANVRGTHQPMSLIIHLALTIYAFFWPVRRQTSEIELGIKDLFPPRTCWL